MSKIRIEELADAIGTELEKYAEVTTDEMKAAVKEVAKETVNDLKKTSPRRTGSYAEGWTAKVTSDYTNGVQVTVYNPTGYRLTHLLENGHAKRGGGRVAAYPHIGPAQDAADMLLEEKLAKVVEG